MSIYVINSLASIIQTRVFTARYRLSLEARVRSLVSPCEICGAKSGNVTGFSQGTLAFPCQNGLPIALRTFSSTSCCYQKDRRAKAGEP